MTVYTGIRRIVEDSVVQSSGQYRPGNVNDGIAGIGIPGNENTGKLRIGNAQFDGIVYKALKNNLGHACEAMPGNNPIGYVVAIELPTNTLPVRKI